MSSHVHVYEKAWLAGGAAQIVIFVSVLLWSAWAQGVKPPSRVETIDPAAVYTDPRFASTGVHETADGGREVVAIAQIWSFVPGELHVPAGVNVTFRVTSPDVSHGFEIVGTNVNTMGLPGYVSQVTTRFDRPGTYLVVCNEYCGTGHHAMSGKLIVEAP